jgi:hypothetical protein
MNYENNPSLAIWIKYQRARYRTNLCVIPKKLNGQTILSSFSNKYKKQHGDLLFPGRYKKNPITLGRWVGTQRQRQLYKSSKLSFECTQKLHDIQFPWDHHETQWLEHFKQLLQYKQEHGNASVPHRYEKYPELHMKKLNDIEFVWDLHEFQWLGYFEQLCKYKEEYGNTLVPAETKRFHLLGHGLPYSILITNVLSSYSIQTKIFCPPTVQGQSIIRHVGEHAAACFFQSQQAFTKTHSSFCYLYFTVNKFFT